MQGLGPFDYLLWFLSLVAEISVLVCLFRAGAVFRYFTLSFFMFVTALITSGRFWVFLQFGYDSPQYGYFYFFSDAFLTLCLYCALMGLYSHVFEEMGVDRQVRAGALLLLGLTTLFSYFVVADASESDKLLGRFVVELSQNLYFVAMVLTYLLWMAIMKLKETRLRLIQLVAALGVYVSAFAANYALHNLSPGYTHLWSYLPPLMSIGLPVAWATTFARVPEEARLATARVAVSQSK